MISPQLIDSNPQRKNTQQTVFIAGTINPQNHRTQYPGYYMTMEYNPVEEQKKSDRFKRKNQKLLKQALLNINQTLGLIVNFHPEEEQIQKKQKQGQNKENNQLQQKSKKQTDEINQSIEY